jgi:RNA polymerase sigma-70 factor, ECF subfamily
VRERRFSEAWQAGRATWPDVELDRERFAAHMESVDPTAASRFPADLYLAAACVARDPAALTIFDRDVLTSARGAIGAIDASAEFIDEALQRLRTNLMVGDGAAPRLLHYAGRGPLRAWVGIAAARTALMMLRSQKRAREVARTDDDWTTTLAMISTNNPELELLKRQYATAFSEALHDAVRELEPRLRAVLKMSFVDALTIDEIGAVYAVHRATAARWIHRACDEVYERTRALLAEKLELSDTDLDRMNALVRSQLDVSLSQLLPADVE